MDGLTSPRQILEIREVHRGPHVQHAVADLERAQLPERLQGHQQRRLGEALGDLQREIGASIHQAGVGVCLQQRPQGLQGVGGEEALGLRRVGQAACPRERHPRAPGQSGRAGTSPPPASPHRGWGGSRYSGRGCRRAGRRASTAHPGPCGRWPRRATSRPPACSSHTASRWPAPVRAGPDAGPPSPPAPRPCRRACPGPWAAGADRNSRPATPPDPGHRARAPRRCRRRSPPRRSPPWCR